MFLELYDYLKNIIPGIRVLRYVSFRILAAMLTTMITTMVLFPWFIRKMKEKSFGQVIRDDGPERHKSKKGTPTMGGTLLIISGVVSILMWGNFRTPLTMDILILLILFAIIGFMDDFLKIKRGSSEGLSVKQKLTFQFLAAIIGLGIFFLFHAKSVNYDFNLYIPFLRSDKYYISLPPVLYFAFAVFFVVFMSNAVNITDGLDGLAIGPTIVALSTFLILSYLSGAKLQAPGMVEPFDFSKYLLIPAVGGANELSVVASALIGGSISFLWWNVFPAAIFLGDVGALAIGAALGGFAIFTKNEILSVIICGVFVFEMLSVVIQRYYYKLTKKRVFKMAPFHHHLELSGWPETVITVRFWLISVLLAIVALISIKLR